MTQEYDYIDCEDCDVNCSECLGMGFHMAIANEGDQDCHFCDGTGSNTEDCSTCDGTRRMRVPKGVGY